MVYLETVHGWNKQRSPVHQPAGGGYMLRPGQRDLKTRSEPNHHELLSLPSAFRKDDLLKAAMRLLYTCGCWRLPSRDSKTRSSRRNLLDAKQHLAPQNVLEGVFEVERNEGQRILQRVRSCSISCTLEKLKMSCGAPGATVPDWHGAKRRVVCA